MNTALGNVELVLSLENAQLGETGVTYWNGMHAGESSTRLSIMVTQGGHCHQEHIFVGAVQEGH